MNCTIQSIKQTMQIVIMQDITRPNTSRPLLPSPFTCANILSVPAWKAGSKEDSKAVLKEEPRADRTVSLWSVICVCVCNGVCMGVCKRMGVFVCVCQGMWLDIIQIQQIRDNQLIKNI